MQAKHGLSKNQVAIKAGIPAQYLSDIKHERRPMTELVARRIAQAFNCNFEWLLGTSDSIANAQVQRATGNANSSWWLPRFDHPIDGEPRANPKWDGASVEVTGVATVKLLLAVQPCVLRFGHDDPRGRLRKGDLILISQAPNENAEFSIVRHRQKSFLARWNADGAWTRVANDTEVPSSCIMTGHCLGVIWPSCVPGD